jgi:hypothetical protein
LTTTKFQAAGDRSGCRSTFETKNATNLQQNASARRSEFTFKTHSVLDSLLKPAISTRFSSDNYRFCFLVNNDAQSRIVVTHVKHQHARIDVGLCEWFAAGGRSCQLDRRRRRTQSSVRHNGRTRHAQIVRTFATTVSRDSASFVQKTKIAEPTGTQLNLHKVHNF